MNEQELIQFVQEIVSKSNDLKNKHTSEKKAPVNYACIFCQSEEQFNEFVEITKNIGEIAQETLTGPLFQIHIDTVAGKLQLLKIRKPDEKRKELGDADFTVSNYFEFKEKYLNKEEFNLIVRKGFEMIELIDPEFDVLVYFSNPPLDKQLGIVTG